MAVENWDTNAAMNNFIEGFDVSEGSIPKDYNDVLRAMAAAIKVFFNKSYRKTENVFIQPTGGSVPAGMQENDILIEYVP